MGGTVLDVEMETCALVFYVWVDHDKIITLG